AARRRSRACLPGCCRRAEPEGEDRRAGRRRARAAGRPGSGQEELGVITADGPDTGRLVGFKRHLRSAVIPGEAAYLLSPLGVTALEGDFIEVLAPLLDGSRTLAGVVRDA